MRRPAVLVVCAALTGCGSGSSSVTTTTATAEQTGTVVRASHLTVRETEFKLDPASAQGGPEGLVRIKLVNDGKVPHALAVAGPNGEVDFDGHANADDIDEEHADPDHHDGLRRIGLLRRDCRYPRYSRVTAISSRPAPLAAIRAPDPAAPSPQIRKRSIPSRRSRQHGIYATACSAQSR